MIDLMLIYQSTEIETCPIQQMSTQKFKTSLQNDTYMQTKQLVNHNFWTSVVH